MKSMPVERMLYRVDWGRRYRAIENCPTGSRMVKGSELIALIRFYAERSR